VVELKDEPQLAVAELGQRDRVQIGVAAAVQPDIPAAGAIEGAEQVQQGAFPRARRPHHREHLAAVHVHVHPAEHLERPFVAAAEHLPKPARFDQRVHS